MRRSRRGDIAFFEFECFAPHATLLAGCTGRGGGVSAPPYDELNLALHVGDEPRAVLENRRRLAAALDVELSSFVVGAQAHSGRAEVVTAADRGRGAFALGDALPHTDALITAERGVVLAVMQADCVPVVLLDPLTPAIGVAHAGWRGTVHHVVRNTVQRMGRELGSDPRSIIAAIGPAIGPGSYEVGADVKERAEREFPRAGVIAARANGRFLLDLWSSNIADLIDAGVPRESIELAGIDTCESSERFFSDRRRRPTGRNMSVAMLRE